MQASSLLTRRRLLGAALAVVMMWFWLSALAVLIGGEINAELERPRRGS